jgi:hypothetical protein
MQKQLSRETIPLKKAIYHFNYRKILCTTTSMWKIDRIFHAKAKSKRFRQIETLLLIKIRILASCT